MVVYELIGPKKTKYRSAPDEHLAKVQVFIDELTAAGEAAAKVGVESKGSLEITVDGITYKGWWEHVG